MVLCLCQAAHDDHAQHRTLSSRLFRYRQLRTVSTTTQPRYRYPRLDDIEDLEKYRPGGFHPVSVGDVFNGGRYKVLHKLGFGRSSTVWRARDQRPKERPRALEAWQLLKSSHDWSKIGTKAELADIIAHFTGVDSDLLKGCPVYHEGGGQGLFADGPLRNPYADDLWGGKAHIHLQHEIIKCSTDHSIFAWGCGEGWDFLACDPSSFSNWVSDPISLIPYETYAQIFAIEHPEHSLTNHGYPCELTIPKEGKYEAALACWRWDDRGSMLGCYLTLSCIEGAQFKARNIYLEHKGYLLAEMLDIRKDPNTYTRVFLVDIGEPHFEVMETTPQRMWRTESETKLYFTADGWFDSRICGAAVIREKTTTRRLAMVLELDGSQERRSPPQLVMDILPENDT
ncbi:hypothetical protein A0H81_01584 [Grifola frondosa]|uniref:non-specific serine/threonine protein kinase n=1 Tax=Grifola frondosa TaxID=5627 RepID=A0A1C7MMJ1_GRIFR|nr:hypothetical protein A0H81_01584 [Grifola frondosa]